MGPLARHPQRAEQVDQGVFADVSFAPFMLVARSLRQVDPA